MKAGADKGKKEFITNPKYHSSKKWTSFMKAIKRREANKRTHPRGSGKRIKRF